MSGGRETPKDRVSKKWRDQEGLHLVGMRAAGQAAEREESEGKADGAEMETYD